MMARRHGINPWVPNQHGAWPMVMIPALAGSFLGYLGPGARTTGSLFTLLLVLVSWFSGYFCFFASGLLYKARRRKRREKYLYPTLCYGVVSGVCAVIALLLQPAVAWWAVIFVPLVGVAMMEMIRENPRSTLSGVVTTCASGTMLAVTDALGRGGGAPFDASSVAIASAVIIALYFTGTVPYVKSMIREKGNHRYWIGSVAFQVLALILSIIVVWWWIPPIPGAVMVLVMAVCVVRAVAIPRSALRGRTWTPKQVGKAEIPPTVALAIAILLAGVPN
ncbi:hypothetical protein GP475_08235 [Corynebacterium poyangense]|uniref:YwiC-like protein n=1 Tax=Corynebacterium poyangense TaxID=2684405 RepID=A0A7H0SQ03_9CORY|nr:YwiC-like family protein [Corynebacterium poyangense]QNQ90628.1 hypothetical protein GP475_08235 [Corynebacterium poyangense]